MSEYTPTIEKIYRLARKQKGSDSCTFSQVGETFKPQNFTPMRLLGKVKKNTSRWLDF